MSTSLPSSSTNQSGCEASPLTHDDVDEFLSSAVKDYFSRCGKTRDRDLIRQGVIEGSFFNGFIEERYGDIIRLLSEDYELMALTVLSHKGQEVADLPSTKIMANYDYFKKQLLKKCNKKQLARELVIYYADMDRLWVIHRSFNFPF